VLRVDIFDNWVKEEYSVLRVDINKAALLVN